MKERTRIGLYNKSITAVCSSSQRVTRWACLLARGRNPLFYRSCAVVGKLTGP